METIIYQGQEIAVGQIGDFSDSGTDVLGRVRCCSQQLYRDEKGGYYVAFSSFNRRTRDEPFESVHRLSLRGAILWAVSLTGYDGLALRQDAAALLRGSARPPREGLHVQIVAGDGTVYGQGRVRSSLYVNLCARANDCPGGWGYTLTDMLERGLRVVNEPGRIIELDDRAESLLEQYEKQHGWDLAEQEIEPVDVVNGVLVNWLEAMLQIREGRTDGAAIEEAMRRRVFGIMDDEPEQESEQRPADPAAVSTQPHEPLTVTLDPDASDCVRRFLQKASYTFDAGDVASGCVVQLLELAFVALEDERNHELASRGRTFADDEWGIAEENAHDARQRRIGLPLFDATEDNAAREVYDAQAAQRLGLAGVRMLPLYTQEQLSEIGRAQVASTTSRTAQREPEVKFSLDAAAHAERHSEPVPIRDVMLDLAANWRIRAATTAGAEAGIMERCAEELETIAAAGKEAR